MRSTALLSFFFIAAFIVPLSCSYKKPDDLSSDLSNDDNWELEKGGKGEGSGSTESGSEKPDSENTEISTTQTVTTKGTEETPSTTASTAAPTSSTESPSTTAPTETSSSTTTPTTIQSQTTTKTPIKTTVSSSTTEAITTSPFTTTEATTQPQTTTKAPDGVITQSSIPSNSQSPLGTSTTNEIDGAIDEEGDSSGSSDYQSPSKGGPPEESSSTGTIVGVVCAVLLIVAIVGVVIFVLKRRKANKKKALLNKSKEGKTSSLVLFGLNQLPPAGRGAGPLGLKKKNKKPRQVQPMVVDEKHHTFMGPLTIDAGPGKGPLRHGQEGVKSHSIRGDIVFDDKLNKVWDIGSDVEILEKTEGETLVVDDDNTLVASHRLIKSEEGQPPVKDGEPPADKDSNNGTSPPVQ